VNADLNRPGMDIVRATDIVDQLDRITSPTLVCVGALDPVTPVGAAEEVAAALPDGRGELVVIEDAGHFTWLDAPERFWPAIIGFVERTAGRPST
jgi:pimeloyl-ACP methyl ester carboxylesterase